MSYTVYQFLWFFLIYSFLGGTLLSIFVVLLTGFILERIYPNAIIRN